MKFEKKKMQIFGYRIIFPLLKFVQTNRIQCAVSFKRHVSVDYQINYFLFPNKSTKNNH